jgi:hypothetical protein
MNTSITFLLLCAVLMAIVQSKRHVEHSGMNKGYKIK